jgi:hypothetical protein
MGAVELKAIRVPVWAVNIESLLGLFGPSAKRVAKRGRALKDIHEKS